MFYSDRFARFESRYDLKLGTFFHGRIFIDYVWHINKTAERLNKADKVDNSNLRKFGRKHLYRTIT